MSTAVLGPADFESAVRAGSAQVISRPSLSYWQDAWIRLKKNRQALVSLWIIVFLVLFTWAGPLVWRVDPADQDTTRISNPPSWGDSALVVEDNGDWSAPRAPGWPAEPEAAPADPSALPPPLGLRVEGRPTSRYVRLRWEPVLGASGYAIYRTEVKPESVEEIGLPIAEVEGGDVVGYEDSFDLTVKTYFYSVAATHAGSGGQTSLVSVNVERGLTVSEAQELVPSAKAGDKVRLATHPLGTDDLGRDLLARLMSGGQISLMIGFFAPLVYILFGILIGGISGFYGGKVDLWIMRGTDLVIGLPFLLFMILFKIAFGVGPGESGVGPMIVALVALSWTGAARLTRGQVLQLRESEFVQAARLLGARPFYLLRRHLIPNLMGILIISFTFGIPSTIFTEAFLSFIGMGVVPPTPSWGSMCNDGIRTFMSHPHEFFFPAVIISVAVLAFNMLGDGLRDALDPKLRGAE